jgi:N,N'-diacetyllegionaminate synthase
MLLKKINIIGEIGSNWNGDIKLAKKLIRLAKNADCDFIKFQFWKSDELFEKSDPNWKYMKKSEFSFKTAKILKTFSDKIGIECIWSVFYPESVTMLEKLNVKCYKIASWTAAMKHPSALDTLNEVAKTKKPVIVSMGFGGNIEKIRKIFKNNPLFFLYCIPDYPTNIQKIDYNKMIKMDGFSDHTEGSLAPIIYGIKSKNITKIKFLEKHISLPESRGPDKPFAMDMSNFTTLINDLRKVHSLKTI